MDLRGGPLTVVGGCRLRTLELITFHLQELDGLPRSTM